MSPGNAARIHNSIGPILAGLAILLSLALAAREAEAAPKTTLGPQVDHHQHLLSPAAAALLEAVPGEGPIKPVPVPPEIAELLARRAAAWNDAKALAEIYAVDPVVVEARPISGAKAVAEFVSSRFARPYSVTPIAYAENGPARQIAILYTRDGGGSTVNVGMGLITVQKNDDGAWRIASESMRFPGPVPDKLIGADDLVRLLDEAEIARAVVLSVAYFFESPILPPQPDGAAALRTENDWTAAEVAKHPARLVGFCSVNPLTEQALPEINRCANALHLKGLKLHFGNSGVDLKKAEHLARIKEVFAAANKLRLPVVVHLWNGRDYGRRDAQIFLREVLPDAPDVPVQIAHMAGAGPGWTDEALEVFAAAIEANDPKTKKVYFDVATVADRQNHEQLELLARRIRQIGPKRILYGSDAAFGGNNPPDQSWGTFRGMVPLSDAEFAVIRNNVAPYLH